MLSTHRLVFCLSLVAIAALGVACGEPPPVVIKPVEEVKPVDPVMSKTADEWFVEGVGLLQSSPPDTTNAQARFENAIKRDEGYVEAYLNLGLIHEEQGKYDDAITLYSTALGKAPENLTLHLAHGRAQLGKNDVDAAIEAFRSALSKDLENRDAMNNLAVTYLRKGDMARAESMVKEVLVLEPDNVVALNTLGRVYITQKKPAVASYVLERARTADPNNSDVLNNLGLIAFDEGKVAKAVELFTSANADAGYSPSRLNLGAIYLDYLDYPSALTQFERAYELMPDSAAAHLGYAASLYGTGEFQKAADLYESYAELHPTHSQPAERLSRLYERQLDNPAKACTWYGKLVEFKPDDPELPVLRDLMCKNAAK